MAITSIKTTSTTTKSSSSSKYNNILILTIVHLLCLGVYLLPILMHPYNNVPAVLDEVHIVSDSNADVSGKTTFREVLTNDYWGRPMNSESSHKSWRPLTILSFRWLQTTWSGRCTLLTTHRIVNALANAAAGESVSILAVQLFESGGMWSSSSLLLLRCLVKLLFCLHPTHVEVTANAANRPHLFAVLVAVVLCDPRLSIFMVLLLQILGLMCSETFLFQMPAVVITQLLITFRKKYFSSQKNDTITNNDNEEEKEDNDTNSKKEVSLSSSSLSMKQILLSSLIKLFPRQLLLFVLSVSYLVMRHSLDWLSIPEGLIRPAENPFYPLEGTDRIRNYAYILAIHVFKSWNFDIIGFSHEYGYECIREIRKWSDPRLGVVFFLIVLYVVVIVKLCNGITKRQKKNNNDYNNDYTRCNSCLFVLFHLSWMFTLFPISGIVKVGTFIADRIVVASTVSTSILLGCYFHQSIVGPSSSQEQKKPRIRLLPSVVVLSLLSYMWYRVHVRSMQWMDNHQLLLSSLKTCPRCAKSHLEISKVYSGLIPELFDLDKSLYHLKQVQSIDDSYCDVHRQLAHVYIQQQRLLEFEEELAEAILCPFDMMGAHDMWNKYWPVVLQDPSAREDGQRRKHGYELKISQAVVREQEELEKGKPQWKGARLNN